MGKHALIVGLLLFTACAFGEEEPWNISGIYPHLAMTNHEGECGTGAVVPWAGRLWVITYAPHKPFGSDDKLYEIDPQLNRVIRPESLGGTPANRMIHRESNQLFIGPYVIDAQGTVRTIPCDKMPGRLTGNARHLTDPENFIYYATMEEGVYEVNVHTLAVKTLYPDANSTGDKAGSLLPGYHGKGLYSGQGRLIYANNGELSKLAQTKPDVASGCLASWDGKTWTVVQRNQFTEVTGPGGLEGNANPEQDSVWSMGWDHRSLILKLLEGGAWHTYRLPKASHCYDGAHGWNAEWPRIRDIGEPDLLMTMHGMFWHFPKIFTVENSAGIAPYATYLKVVGDFCRWGDRLVMGCDDTAQAEFLNKRRAKGELAGPGQSQSNLWFLRPEQLGQFGPALGRGGLWMQEPVRRNSVSDPFLFSGFTRRGVFLAHDNPEPVTFTFEVDRLGNNVWTPLHTVTVPAKRCQWHAFDTGEQGAWVRVQTDRDCERATVFFQYTNVDHRAIEPASLATGLAEPADQTLLGGLVYAEGSDKGTLRLLATAVQSGKIKKTALYELDADMILKPVDDPKG